MFVFLFFFFVLQGRPRKKRETGSPNRALEANHAREKPSSSGRANRKRDTYSHTQDRSLAEQNGGHKLTEYNKSEAKYSLKETVLQEKDSADKFVQEKGDHAIEKTTKGVQNDFKHIGDGDRSENREYTRGKDDVDKREGPDGTDKTVQEDGHRQGEKEGPFHQAGQPHKHHKYHIKIVGDSANGKAKESKQSSREKEGRNGDDVKKHSNSEERDEGKSPERGYHQKPLDKSAHGASSERSGTIGHKDDGRNTGATESANRNTKDSSSKTGRLSENESEENRVQYDNPDDENELFDSKTTQNSQSEGVEKPEQSSDDQGGIRGAGTWLFRKIKSFVADTVLGNKQDTSKEQMNADKNDKATNPQDEEGSKQGEPNHNTKSGRHYEHRQGGSKEKDERRINPKGELEERSKSEGKSHLSQTSKFGHSHQRPLNQEGKKQRTQPTSSKPRQRGEAQHNRDEEHKHLGNHKVLHYSHRAEETTEGSTKNRNTADFAKHKAAHSMKHYPTISTIHKTASSMLIKNDHLQHKVPPEYGHKSMLIKNDHQQHKVPPEDGHKSMLMKNDHQQYKVPPEVGHNSMLIKNYHKQHKVPPEVGHNNMERHTVLSAENRTRVEKQLPGTSERKQVLAIKGRIEKTKEQNDTHENLKIEKTDRTQDKTPGGGEDKKDSEELFGRSDQDGHKSPKSDEKSYTLHRAIVEREEEVDEGSDEDGDDDTENEDEDCDDGGDNCYGGRESDEVPHYAKETKGNDDDNDDEDDYSDDEEDDDDDDADDDDDDSEDDDDGLGQLDSPAGPIYNLKRFAGASDVESDITTWESADNAQASLAPDQPSLFNTSRCRVVQPCVTYTLKCRHGSGTQADFESD